MMAEIIALSLLAVENLPGTLWSETSRFWEICYGTPGLFGYWLSMVTCFLMPSILFRFEESWESWMALVILDLESCLPTPDSRLRTCDFVMDWLGLLFLCMETISSAGELTSSRMTITWFEQSWS